MTGLEQVLEALSLLRAPQAAQEADLQLAVERCLQDAGIVFHREAVLGKGARIDFLTEDGVGIELKKGRPVASGLKKQLLRYAAFDEIKAIVAVTQKTAGIPRQVGGKPCVEIGLNRLWGIAL